MSERLVRGYAILATLAHIDEAHASEKPKILASLKPEVRQAIADCKQMGWYPIHYWSDLLRGISLLYPDEQQVIDALTRCGQSVAKLATNTFLRLLLRIMSPSMFSTKLASIWQRDNNSGAFVRESFDADARVWTVRLSDVEGYDWVGPVARGWILFAMNSMVKDARVRMTGWSLSNPGPKDVLYTVEWSS